PPTPPLSPYTTLFRSEFGAGLDSDAGVLFEAAHRVHGGSGGAEPRSGPHGESRHQRADGHDRNGQGGPDRAGGDSAREPERRDPDRKSTRLNSSHVAI